MVLTCFRVAQLALDGAFGPPLLLRCQPVCSTGYAGDGERPRRGLGSGVRGLLASCLRDRLLAV